MHLLYTAAPRNNSLVGGDTGGAATLVGAISSLFFHVTFHTVPATLARACSVYAFSACRILRRLLTCGCNGGICCDLKHSAGFSWPKIKKSRDEYILRLNGMYDNNLDRSSIPKIVGKGVLTGNNTVEVRRARLWWWIACVMVFLFILFPVCCGRTAVMTS